MTRLLGTNHEQRIQECESDLLSFEVVPVLDDQELGQVLGASQE